MAGLRLVTATDAENPILGDLQLRNGQLAWLGLDQDDPEDQADMVAQRVRSRLMVVRGEWYQDQRIGFPWREYALGKAGVIAGPAKLRALFVSAISAVPGVREVRSLVVVIDRRARSVDIRASFTTVEGAIIDVPALDAPWIVRAAA